MPVQMQLSGSESLAQKLQALSEAARGQALERALVAGALLVQNAAKENAPFVTGTLRRSLHIGGHKDLNPDGLGGQLPDPEVEGGSVTVYVGTDVEYARRIEFGFEGADALGRTYHQPAQPYLRPAIDENGAAVQREVGAALRDLLRAALR
jgi:HK97 gp10 family phage protein